MIIVGFLAGIISGMGIGGGTILIPALTLLFDMEQKTAQSINLLYFVPTAIIALTTHIKAKRVEGRLLVPLIVSGLAGAAAGAFLALGLDSSLLKRLFGVFLLLMGLREIYMGFKEKSKKKQV